MTAPTANRNDRDEALADRNRLALLWKAFEEAEQRIAELESELDRRHAPAAPPAAMAPAPAAAPQEAVRREAHEVVDVRYQNDARQAQALAEAELVAEAARLRELVARLESADQRQRQEQAAALERVEKDHAASRAEATRLQETLHEATREREKRRALSALESLDAQRALHQRALDERAAAAARAADLERELQRARQVREDVLAKLDEAERKLRAEEARHGATRQALARAGSATDVAALQNDRLNDALARMAAELAWANARLEAAEAGRREMETRMRPRASPLQPVRILPLDVDRVADIAGIRPDEVAALRRFGVNMADALLYADLAALSAAAGIGLPRLAKLRTLAELMALRGIGPEWADRLHRQGIRSLREVAALTAEAFEDVIVRDSRGDMGPEGLALLQRTLPARARAIVAEARRATAG